jgi:type I restriction enzyme, R subunit
VMIEHFRHHVQRKIDGRAKAMVVTRSRLHAVRYKLAFDAYIRERGYLGLQALVAFSGTVRDPDGGAEYTEVQMNAGIKEKELPDKFATPEYQVLLVANKYQTGFDQPLLCAMYVDKKLSGVQAVQTLSRLNRTCPGKEETFVLDFANEAEEIYAAFQPFYEQTTVSERADPYQLEQLARELDTAHVYTDDELEAFAKVFYRPKQALTDKEHGELHAQLEPALKRFKQWDDEEAREKWRAQLQAFVRLYAFLSQVMPWTDRELEIRYSFGKFLLRRLPRDEHAPLDLSSDVDLHSYRLSRIAEADIALEKGQVGELKGPTDVGTRKAQDEEIALKDIIDQLNIRFGTEFTERDRLLFDAVIEDGKADEQVRQRAEANTYENFELSVRDKIQDLMIDRMDRNAGIVSKFLDEDDFKRAVIEHIARKIYDGLRKAG